MFGAVDVLWAVVSFLALAVVVAMLVWWLWRRTE